MDKCNS